MTEDGAKVGAVILAAGMSTRMGKPKMLLPWGRVTILEQVVSTLLAAGFLQPVVVTGANQTQICSLLMKYPVRTVFNPRYQDGEMLHSMQAGIAVILETYQKVLVVLGDQPQMQTATVKAILEESNACHSDLIIPSYQMRRGHPWLIGKALWPEILALELPYTLRDFLGRHSAEIHYLNVGTPSILEDLDTPDEYQKFRP